MGGGRIHGVIIKKEYGGIGEKDKEREPGRKQRRKIDGLESDALAWFLEYVRPLVESEDMAMAAAWAILDEFDDDLADIFLIMIEG